MELKELQIRNLYKYIVFVLLISCQSKVKNIPDVFVEVAAEGMKNNNGIWLYQNEKFNGFLIEKKNNKLISKLPILDGKENGIGYGWFENGKLKYQKEFVNGNREGTHIGWYDNGKIAFVNLFHDDKYDGYQKMYYSDGKRSQLLHYQNGYEEGKQKFWNQKGRLINNFTVKNGKLYGVIGRYDCMSVTKN